LGSGLLLFSVLVTLSSLVLWWLFIAYILSLLLCCSPSSFSISALVAWVSLCGLPPFPLFQSKVLALLLSPSFSGLLLLIIGCVTLFPYISLGLTSSSPVRSSFTSLFGFCFLWAALLGICLPVL